MTREGQLVGDHRRAITAPSALRWSLWSDTTVMVSANGEVIVRWFGRLAGSSGVWAGGLSVTALLTARCLGCAHGLGNDPQGFHEFVGVLVVVLTATKKTFPTLREKVTEGYSSGRCG